MQNETLSIDELADPILQNDTAQALDTFSDTYAEIVKRRFGTDNVERDVLLQRIQANMELKDYSGLMEDELMQVINFKKDMLNGSRIYMADGKLEQFY